MVLLGTEKDTMIIVRLYAGLGNQLFQYAFGRKWANYHRTTLKIDRSWYDRENPGKGVTKRPFVLDRFLLPLEEASREDFRQIGIPLSAKNHFWAKAQRKAMAALHPRYIRQQGITDLYTERTVPDNSYLHGYWVCKHHVSDIWQEMKGQLVLSPGLTQPSITLDAIQDSKSVAMHIRRGDYLTTGNFQLSTFYYQNAIRRMIQLVGEDIHLFIFSDDIEWSQKAWGGKLSDWKIKATFIGEEVPRGIHDLYHFYLMTQCKHFIIANSTFSWWAAWMGEEKSKTVLCPAQFSFSNRQHRYIIVDGWHPVPIDEEVG